MRLLSVVFQVAIWGVGAWLLICLLGAMHKLSSASEVRPEAVFAGAMALVLMLGFVTAFYLYETFSTKPAPAETFA